VTAAASGAWRASRNLDAGQSSVHLSPYPSDEEAPPTAMRTQDDCGSATEIHMAARLEDYASGKLDPSLTAELEAHLVVCDACFAAYVALLVRRSS
jgi:putative zinc finger protein